MLYVAAQSKGGLTNRKTCETVVTEWRFKLQGDHPATAPPLLTNEGKALWATWQIDYIGPFKSSVGYRYTLTRLEGLPIPAAIQSDNSVCFSCKEVQDWVK